MTKASPAATASTLAKALEAHRGSLRAHEAFNIAIDTMFCAIRRDDELAEKIRIRLAKEAPKLGVEFIAPLGGAICEFGLGGDILGQIASGTSSLSKDLGQFFTPPEVARLCAALSVDTADLLRHHCEDGIVRMHEPTIGSGVMALAWADFVASAGVPLRDIYIEGWDIDALAAKMAFVQLAFCNVPATIVLGDVLSREVRGIWETPARVAQRERQELRQAVALFMTAMSGPDGLDAPEKGEDLAPAA